MHCKKSMYMCVVHLVWDCAASIGQNSCHLFFGCGRKRLCVRLSRSRICERYRCGQIFPCRWSVSHLVVDVDERDTSSGTSKTLRLNESLKKHIQCTLPFDVRCGHKFENKRGPGGNLFRMAPQFQNRRTTTWPTYRTAFALLSQYINSSLSLYAGSHF